LYWSAQNVSTIGFCTKAVAVMWFDDLVIEGK